MKLLLFQTLKSKGESMMLSQQHYVENFLNKFGYFEEKPITTPYKVNSHLVKNSNDLVAQFEYAQIIGSLMHLMTFSRIDIAYDVC